jgi:ParB-like chromosome segregation protein Spo0J
MINLNTIKLNPNNPRSIKEDKFKKLVESIKESTKFLEARPIVIKDGTVYGGNMRLRALQKLGYTEVPDEWIKDVSGWTAEDIHKFIVIDNIAYGDNDWDLISEQYEKEELEDWGMDVDRWGENYGEDFSLPDGDKAGFQQITFTQADEQAEVLKQCVAEAKDLKLETFDNENSNGNAIYWVCKQWMSNK